MNHSCFLKTLRKSLIAVAFSAFSSFHQSQAQQLQAPLVSPFATPSPEAPPKAAPDAFNMPGSPIMGQLPPPPLPPDALPPNQFEKCYGVAGENQNHCAYASFDGSSSNCAGQAKGCDPAAWRWVPAGLCKRISVGWDKNNKIISGSMIPSSERGMPEVCYPFDPQQIPANDSGF